MHIDQIAYDISRKVWENAVNPANDERKRDQAKRFDYYKDGQLDYLKEQLAAQFADISQFQLGFINIVKKIINNKAMVYIEPPKRELDGSEQDQALFDEIAEDCGLNLVMKDASKLSKLLKTVLIRPVYANGKMRLDIVLPHLVDVETGDSPKDLEEVLVTHWPESGRHDEVTFKHWTPEVVRTLDWRGQEVAAEPNPYGILPFVPLWDGDPVDTFWLQGGDDLVNAQEQVNHKLTDLLHVMRTQGFGTPVFKGVDIGQAFQFSPLQALNVPEEGDFEYAAPNAPMMDVWAIIQGIAQQTAINNGLSASILSTEPSEQSGIAKIVDSRELSEMRQDDIERFRRYERQVFNVLRTVWNVHNPGHNLSEAATMTVDFFDVKKATTEDERQAGWMFYKDEGVVTVLDLIMERNPDISTREEAEEVYKRLCEERQRLAKYSGQGMPDESFLDAVNNTEED